jgi:hypothetical protein
MSSFGYIFLPIYSSFSIFQKYSEGAQLPILSIMSTIRDHFHIITLSLLKYDTD